MKYRVSQSKLTKVNWVWQIKICKINFVWKWFCNPEIGRFLELQGVSYWNGQNWMALILMVGSSLAPKLSNPVPSCGMDHQKSIFFTDIWYPFCQRLLRPANVTFLKTSWWNSINYTNPRTNPWHFWKKIMRMGGIEKHSFFESTILEFFFQIFFCCIPTKISQRFLASKDWSKFW